MQSFTYHNWSTWLFSIHFHRWFLKLAYIQFQPGYVIMRYSRYKCFQRWPELSDGLCLLTNVFDLCILLFKDLNVKRTSGKIKLSNQIKSDEIMIIMKFYNCSISLYHINCTCHYRYHITMCHINVHVSCHYIWYWMHHITLYHIIMHHIAVTYHYVSYHCNISLCIISL